MPTDSTVLDPSARRDAGQEAGSTGIRATRVRAAPDTSRLDSWIELDAAAYRANLAFVRQAIGPDVELAAVVKSNAYGHGRRWIAGLAVEGGADSFAVHALDEALDLRAAGFSQDVLIMGPVPLPRLEEVVAEDFRLVLFALPTARRLAEITAARGMRARVHLKIETGTHRQGVEGEELDQLLAFLREQPTIEVEGIYTHFADIEDTTDHSYARQQLERFATALETVRRAGFDPPKRHAACSAAALLFAETHFDMVRLGISQYGFWSSSETRLSYEHAHGRGTADLRPVLSFKTRVGQVKTVPAGSMVGYGCTYQTTRETRLAVLPTGYADGYDRHLSNAGWVLIRGRRAPVRGRVCMNLTLVDVTDIPGVELGDEVVLIGRQGEQEVGAEDLAGLIGTISYEVVTRLASTIPRFVVEG